MEEKLDAILNELRAIREHLEGQRGFKNVYDTVRQISIGDEDSDGYVWREEDYNPETKRYEKYHHMT